MNLAVELWKIIRHFFPELMTLLENREDPRHQSYIEYENKVILFTRILATVFRIGSMRQITEALNHRISIQNVGTMLELDEELTELPHWSTINDYLEKLPSTESEAIIPKLVYRITRMRSFENSRIRGKYWHMVVDGTQLYSFDERHCAHCLTREFKNEAGEVVRTQYYHALLEAKLVLNENMVISLATEFVENETATVEKQDCELNAFYRLAAKLKKRFPRLPLCLGMDSLYAADPVFSLCREYGWRYIIRFKDGSIPSVAKEFDVLKHLEPTQTWSKTVNDIEETYRYVTDIAYQTHELNMVEYTQSDRTYPFVFVTDLPVSKRNCEQLVLAGRRRWKIENEGFNAQKCQGLALEHLFSRNYNAMKNHYFLIQIGHMIAQFLEAGLRQLTELSKVSSCSLFGLLKESLRTVSLTALDYEVVEVRRQYRFR